MSVMGSVLSALAGKALEGIAPEVGKYFRERQANKHEIEMQEHRIEMERLRGKQAWEEAQTRRAEASEGRDHEWEMQSLLIHSGGWKDEFVLIVLSVPAIMAFIPGLDKYVVDGFAALGTTPYWYQTLLVAIYFAIYGIRAVRRDAVKTDLLKGMAKQDSKQGK